MSDLTPAPDSDAADSPAPTAATPGAGHRSRLLRRELRWYHGFILALILLVVAVAAAIVVLGLGVTSLRGVALAMLTVGVPITLSVIAVTVVNRRA